MKQLGALIGSRLWVLLNIVVDAGFLGLWLGVLRLFDEVTVNVQDKGALDWMTAKVILGVATLLLIIIFLYWDLRLVYEKQRTRFQEERRRMEENRRKFEEDCRKFEEDRRKFEEDRRKFEEDRRKFEEERKSEEQRRRMEEDRRKVAGPPPSVSGGEERDEHADQTG
jgi:hypothetical protein